MHDDDTTLDGVVHDELDPGAPLTLKRAFVWGTFAGYDIFWWMR